jgi:Fe-S-cluster containining protein
MSKTNEAEVGFVRLSSLFEKTSQWFDRTHASLLGSLPCRHGCSHCCIGLFPVTILDRQEIQRGLQSLSDDHRQAITQKASEQVAALTGTAPQLASTPFIDGWPDEAVDRIITQFEAVPCPALGQDGGCGVYDFRPLVCRSMGIPPDDGIRVTGACAVQTAVPLIRPPKVLWGEETRLAGVEAEQLEAMRLRLGIGGEELFLPYAFLT